MKYILLISFALFFSSCEENIQSYDDLTEDEQEYIRTRAEAKCLADSQSNFTALKETSNDKMADFVRGDFWEITVIGTTTPDYLYVWKVDGTTVYFLYQQKLGTTTYHQFIKMTPTFNGEMMDNLLVQKCDSKTPLITQSSTSFSIKYVDIISTEGSTEYRTDTTYSSLDDYPAFFALFTQKVFKEKLDSNRNVVSSENLTNAVTYKGDDAVLLATFDLYSNKKYCVFTYVNAVPKTFTFPYALTCVDVLATNPNLGLGDATLDFTSADL